VVARPAFDDALARPAKRRQRPQARCAPASRGKPVREIGRRLAVANQANDPRAAREQRHQPLERRSMQGDADRLFERPAETRSGQRECGRRRMRDPFVARQLRGERRARAMPERIAGGEHRRRPRATGEHRRDVERHRPGPSASADIGELQVPLTAEHDLGFRKRLSACVREPGKAIFADAYDGQPGFTHDARAHSGRNRRRQPPR